MRRRRKREYEQLPIRRFSKTLSTINLLRWTIVVTCFNGHSPDASSLTKTAYLGQRRGAETTVTPVWLHIKIIQTGNQTAIFHSVFQSQDEVPNIVLFFLDNPDVSQTFIVEQGGECSGCSLVIEGVTAFSIELSHQANQHGEFILTRSSHLTVIRGVGIRSAYHPSTCVRFLRRFQPSRRETGSCVPLARRSVTIFWRQAAMPLEIRLN